MMSTTTLTLCQPSQQLLWHCVRLVNNTPTRVSVVIDYVGIVTA